MKVVKCINGHYFDADETERCPYCNGESIEAEIKDNKTPAKVNEDDLQVNAGRARINEERPQVNADRERIIEERARSNAERAIVKEARATDNEEKTIVVTPVSRSGIRGTHNISGIKKVEDPRKDLKKTAGWLVSIKGPYYGESFSIYYGKNSIGAGEDSKIRLDKDISIQDDKCADIIFEPKNKEFYINPGNGSAIVYLNDQMILQHKRLFKNDRIEIGNGIYSFIPLCGDGFEWEE